MAANKSLPQIQRYITTTGPDGKAVFDTSIPTAADFQSVSPEADFFLGYTTSHFPPSLTNSADIKSYASYRGSAPGLSIRGGTVLRFVDMAPNHLSPMHKTVSLDYGIVIEGEVICVLDSGEERRMKRGDVAVQRGTLHAWKNPTNEWARVAFVLQECEMEGLKEDLAGIENVRHSS